MQPKTDGIDSNGWSQGRVTTTTTMTTTRATRLLMMMMRCEETPRQLPRASFSSTTSSLLCLSLSASSRLVIIVPCGFLVASEFLPSACRRFFSPFFPYLSEETRRISSTDRYFDSRDLYGMACWMFFRAERKSRLVKLYAKPVMNITRF